MDADKLIEYQRYNESSKNRLVALSEEPLLVNGSSNFPAYLRSPYLYYEDIVRMTIKPEMRVLDLCCGDGIHSIGLGYLSNHVVATDIAENSLEIAKIRARLANVVSITFQKGDAELLDFADNSFDVVTCVGSISYVDIEKFTNEVLRVLKPSGKFIAVDSFNHNPIFRLNRYIHYLRGTRSLSTLNRMPSSKTLAYFETVFKTTKVNYFGAFVFLGRFLEKFFGENRTEKLINNLDERMDFLRKYSFKFVIISIK